MLLRESVIALDPGSVLAGRYQIRRVVGKGATGVVLEADDRVSRSLVALKVFKPDIATDDRWQEIVGSELRHARRLSHPNVCRVFDAGEANGYRFLSMEYAPGGSLRQRLKDAAAATDGGTQARPMEEKVADGRAVVDGMAAIHGAGIIHRDVKPDNVLRMEDGRLVVTDFGLAVAPGTTTFMSGYSGAVGTPSYMAPEVALGGDATMASDVFAVGVILHEIFFGRRPEWETTKRGRFVKPPAVRKGSRIERSMSRLCLECLDPLAPNRPQNAGEVKKKYERAVLGHYGSFKGAMRAGKWGIVAGAMLSATVVAVMVIQARRNSPDRVADVNGTARDWSRDSRMLVKLTDIIECTYPSSDGRTIGVLWGKPRQAARVELPSGQLSPWPLHPDLMKSTYCPQWSPDGRRVAFTSERPSQISISATAEGGGAQRIGPGFYPRWLNGGRELVFAVDRRRLATSDTVATPAFLPEAVAAEERVHDIRVNDAGTRVAALYVDFKNDRSALVTYEYPAWRVSRRLLPGPSRALHFDLKGQSPAVLLKEDRQDTVVRLDGDGNLSRVGSMGKTAIVDIGWQQTRRLLTVVRSSMSLSVEEPDGRERLLATAFRFGRPSLNERGEAVLEQADGDGRTVIAHYDPTTGRLKHITHGGHETTPQMIPGTTEFAYVDRAGQRGVSRCDLGRPTDCRLWVKDSDAQDLLGTAPSGRRVAYAANAGLQVRLRLGGDSSGPADLGPIDRICPVKWAEEGRLWRFSAAPFTGWLEYDVVSGQMTGVREAVTLGPGERCPDQGSRLGGLKLSKRPDSELWLTGGSD